MSFPALHYYHGASFYVKFYPYVRTVYSHCLHKGFHFFFAKNFMSTKYIRGLTFSCDLLSLYPPVYFLGMWLSDTIAITNSNCDSASPRNIDLRVFFFASIQLIPFAANSALQVFRIFFDKVHDFVWYHVHFETVYLPGLRDYIMCLLIVNPLHR